MIHRELRSRPRMSLGMRAALLLIPAAVLPARSLDMFSLPAVRIGIAARAQRGHLPEYFRSIDSQRTRNAQPDVEVVHEGKRCPNSPSGTIGSEKLVWKEVGIF